MVGRAMRKYNDGAEMQVELASQMFNWWHYL